MITLTSRLMKDVGMPSPASMTAHCDHENCPQSVENVRYFKSKGGAIYGVEIPPKNDGEGAWKIDPSNDGGDLCPDCNDPRCDVCGDPLEKPPCEFPHHRFCSKRECLPF